MKEEMKETIQEDLNNFKSWGVNNLTWLKKWWVRLIVSGVIGFLFSLWQEKRLCEASSSEEKYMWDIENVLMLFFFLSYVALYFLVVWIYGKDKNK